jgi:FkbM family methyltransferase
LKGRFTSLFRAIAPPPPHPRPPDIFTDNQDFFTAFKTILDVGAHHGLFTEKLKLSAPRAVIHAFEPFPSSYSVLREKFRVDERVVLNNLAVTDSVGGSPFYSNVGDETNSLLPSVSVDRQVDVLTKNLSVIDVQTTTIDSYARQIDLSEIDFIKIDVQGNTFSVLEGAKEMLGGHSIRWIYAEVEFVEIYRNEKRFSEIELFLRNYGYEFVKFYNFNFTDRGILAWADALFRLGPAR